MRYSILSHRMFPQAYSSLLVAVVSGVAMPCITTAATLQHRQCESVCLLAQRATTSNWQAAEAEALWLATLRAGLHLRSSLPSGQGYTHSSVA